MNTYRHYILWVMLCLSTGLYGQVDSSYYRYLDTKKKAFETYRDKKVNTFETYQQEAMQRWTEYLDKKWVAFEVLMGEEPPKDPDPVTYPSFQYEPQQAEDWGNFAGGIKDPAENVAMLPVSRDTSDYAPMVHAMPLDFYGKTYYISLDPSLLIAEAVTIDQSFISTFWRYVENRQYVGTLEDLLATKAALNLNDFTFALLVHRFSSELTKNEDLALCYTWFFLVNARYQVKIGSSGDQFDLKIPVGHKVYRQPFIELGGQRYFSFRSLFSEYMPGDPPAFDASYFGMEQDHPSAVRIFHFGFERPLSLPLREQTRTLAFEGPSATYEIDVRYNLNEVDLLAGYPQCGIGVYVNSPFSSHTRESLRSAIVPYIANLSNLDKVDFLLKLTQNAFEYQADQEQFDAEKWFFPSEILHYPYSDCDDRAIFYSRLIHEFTDNEIATLLYPSHVSTAVRFAEGNPVGDYVILNNSRFVICDPTYRNAPVGKGMDSYKGVPAREFVTLRRKSQQLTRTVKTDQTEYYVRQTFENANGSFNVLQDLNDPSQYVVLQSEAGNIVNSWELDVASSATDATGVLFSLNDVSEGDRFAELENFGGFGVTNVGKDPVLILETGLTMEERKPGAASEIVRSVLETAEAGSRLSFMALLEELSWSRADLGVDELLSEWDKVTSARSGELEYLNTLDRMQVNDNVLTLKTDDANGNRIGQLYVENGARILLVSYPSGNQKLEVINGIHLEVFGQREPLRNIKLQRGNEDVILELEKGGDKVNMTFAEAFLQ